MSLMRSDSDVLRKGRARTVLKGAHSSFFFGEGTYMPLACHYGQLPAVTAQTVFSQPPKASGYHPLCRSTTNSTAPLAALHWETDAAGNACEPGGPPLGKRLGEQEAAAVQPLQPRLGLEGYLLRHPLLEQGPGLGMATFWCRVTANLS